MKRRNFILGTAAVITAVSAGSYYYYFFYDGTEGGVLHAFIQDFLSEEELSNILKEYKKESIQHASLQLKEPELIRNKIKEDFSLDKVKLCDGWVLSETELNFLAKERVSS